VPAAAWRHEPSAVAIVLTIVRVEALRQPPQPTAHSCLSGRPCRDAHGPKACRTTGPGAVARNVSVAAGDVCPACVTAGAQRHTRLTSPQPHTRFTSPQRHTRFTSPPAAHTAHVPPVAHTAHVPPSGTHGSRPRSGTAGQTSRAGGSGRARVARGNRARAARVPLAGPVRHACHWPCHFRCHLPLPCRRRGPRARRAWCAGSGGPGPRRYRLGRQGLPCPRPRLPWHVPATRPWTRARGARAASMHGMPRVQHASPSCCTRGSLVCGRRANPCRDWW
jgi:hypothetical protein